jgi:aminopeptidase N
MPCKHKAPITYPTAPIGARDAQLFTLKYEDPSQLFSPSTNYAPDIQYEPFHTDLSVSISSLKSKTMRVRVTISIRVNKTQTGSDILEFDAVKFDDFVVEDNIYVDKWQYNGNKVTVTLANRSLKRGEELAVTMTYSVISARPGLVYNETQSRIRDKRQIGEYMVTDVESQLARHWLACIDHPSIRTTLDIKLTAPSKYSCFANGVMKTMNKIESDTTTQWVLDTPCPAYLIVIAIGEFVTYKPVVDPNVTTVDIMHIAPKGIDVECLELTFGKTPEMIQWLEKLLDKPFPYAKYYSLAAPKLFAMENISLPVSS